MRKTRVTRLMALALLALLVTIPLAGACARPAPAPPPTPVPAPKPAPAPAPAPKANPLAQIIEGATKEGQVFITATTDHAKAASIERLRKEIREKYGADLKISVTYVEGQAGILATAIMEHKTGAVPTVDLQGVGGSYIPEGMKSGALERVDWKSLVPAGTPPEVILQQPDLRGSIAYYSNMYGLLYNPDKVPAAEVPKKLSDLADPKWKGRLGIFNYASHWTRWTFVLGKDKTMATARSIMKNKPLQGGFPDLNNRYLIGEFDLAFMHNTYVLPNRAKGVPTAWRNLDFIDAEDSVLAVRTRAAHPNAAKLVAVYLTSPEGAKFNAEIGRPFQYYPGNLLYDMREQGKKEGLSVGGLETTQGLLDLVLTPEYERWQKEIQLILQSG
ncbi:MAG: extracellular solute-binding protein [Chloroflexi bacterium]|nr:extracellular solute-binding protein [Chloroflexota bacterium]